MSFALVLDALSLIFSEFITPTQYIELVQLLRKCHEKGVGVSVDGSAELKNRGFPVDYRYYDHLGRLRFGCQGFQAEPNERLNRVMDALREACAS
nr:hypothetical protein TetV2_00167 [Oceanusvirus sp.]